MKTCLPILLFCLPACSLFGVLTDAEQNQVTEHRIRCEQYFHAGKYEKAIDQAQRGLAISPKDYPLRSRLGWSYLELASRTKEDNVENLRRARVTFAEIMSWRGTDDHASRTIFGYAKTLHNQARIEHLRAKMLKEDSQAPGNNKEQLLAQAKQYTERGQEYERQSAQHFLTLAEGSVAGNANRREAYEYLMVLMYRVKDLNRAILYGNKYLEQTKQQIAYWNEKYQTTKLPDYEKLARNELARLGKSATAVHSSLAKYHRENAQFDQAITHLDAVIAARPQSYQDYYRRGICHRHQSNRAKAREDFQMFLQISNLPKQDKLFQDAYQYVYGKGK